MFYYCYKITMNEQTFSIFLQSNTKYIQYRNAKSHKNNSGGNNVLRGPHVLINRTTNGIYIYVLFYINTKENKVWVKI